MESEETKVWVAMSGGVDSSVAALLLKRAGYDVTGVYMKNWSDPLADECPWKQDIKDFLSVCRVLNIPHRIEVFEEEYRKKIVAYLINGYRQGITPNPDMLCNREIKFKVFLEKALKQGAGMIATGHYVMKKIAKGGKQYLYRAHDSNKDQSYFLALLNQFQLRHSLFPIGNYTKPQVRALAKRANLPVHDKKDSQGICFIGKVKFRDFIRQFIKQKPGRIVTTNGTIIGNHDGLSFYTIGQRHGLKIGGGVPFYVTGKNKRHNTLIVSASQKDTALLKKNLMVKNISWISGTKPASSFDCLARIRYRQPLQKCHVQVTDNAARIVFARVQRAITPGQFVVLYSGQQLLGGGIISE